MRDKLADVIIPVIHNIWEGNTHTEAIKTIATKQKYSNSSTVYERCTRDLGFDSISEFLDLINSDTPDKIRQYLIKKFPKRIDLINEKLPITFG